MAELMSIIPLAAQNSQLTESLIVLAEIKALAQLVEALRYKPEGRGFDSRWCHWKFSLT
jgi:hypothetical protein